jgi:hypothetical protein
VCLIDELLLLLIELTIPLAKDYSLDSSIDYELKTREARGAGYIDVAAVDCIAILRRLTDGILLGMHAETLVEFLSCGMGMATSRASAVEAVRRAGGCAVVARRYDVVVLDDNRPYLAAGAVATGSNVSGYAEKVILPRGTRVFLLVELALRFF